MTVFVGVVRESIIFRWFILDLSTIVFIFLIFNLKLNYVNNLIHYYLVQVRARIGLFFSILFSVRGYVRLEYLFLLLKLGIFPFHFWYLRLLAKLDWESIFLLISPRKLIVLVMLFNFLSHRVFWILAVNLGFVLYRRLCEKHLKVLLGLSSIFNMVWVLSRLVVNYYWLLFFAGYSLNLFLMLWVLERLAKCKVRDIAQFFEVECCVFLGMSVFTFLGIPPFLRFFIKVLILREFIYLGVMYVILVLRRIVFAYLYLIFFFNAMSSYLENRGVFRDLKVNFYLFWVLGVNMLFTINLLFFYYLNNIIR